MHTQKRHSHSATHEPCGTAWRAARQWAHAEATSQSRLIVFIPPGILLLIEHVPEPKRYSINELEDVQQRLGVQDGTVQRRMYRTALSELGVQTSEEGQSSFSLDVLVLGEKCIIQGNTGDSCSSMIEKLEQT
jgi:hypothetical protein